MRRTNFIRFMRALDLPLMFSKDSVVLYSDDACTEKR